MSLLARLLAAAAFAALALPAAAQVRFYENDNFAGRSFNADRAVGDFARFGFNDKASSAVVRGGRWDICTDARFGGRCVTLRAGRYASLGAMGLNDSISSARPSVRRRR